MKMSLQETQPVVSRGFSLRSVLLLVLLVGIGAGATAYVLGNAFAPISGTSSTGISQQSTTTTSASTTSHNCTLTSTQRVSTLGRSDPIFFGSLVQAFAGHSRAISPILLQVMPRTGFPVPEFDTSEIRFIPPPSLSRSHSPCA